MKNIRTILSLIIISLFTIGCEVEGINYDVPSVSDVNSGNYDKVVDISTDNTGTVRITPLGTGISKSVVQFGHGSGVSSSATVMPGQSVTHIYPEGNYTITITSYDLSGKETTATYPVAVKFTAPTDLKIDTQVSGFNVTVKPTAMNANGGYNVKFGDVTGETGVLVADGSSVTHTYAKAGVYNVTVTALSGGVATTSATTQVTIYNPFALPVTNDDPYTNYAVGGVIGGAEATVVDNPFSGGINTSAKVWKFTKTLNAQTWAGTWTPLGAPNGVPINIDNGRKFKVMVYATETGKNLHFQLEDGSDYKPSVDIPITVANQWQEIVFDFTSHNIPEGHIFNQYVFQYNLSGSGEGEVIYIDNITQTN